MDGRHDDARVTDRSRPDGPVTPALSVGSLAAVLASSLGSALAAGVAPEVLRIHWTLGAGPYYGPEFAPAWVVLGAFPLLIGGLALVAHRVGALAAGTDSFDPVRPYYAPAVLATLFGLLTAQAALVLVNVT